MADISLVCMREDAYKADQLAGALERYGFSVCRSASVFEDFQGYGAVIVLLSPGAARSDLVMGTAQRAMDYGKLIPVFVNLCRLPDRLAGVALHDLSQWDGAEEDRVVQAIAYHAQRLAGLPGHPELGPPSARAMLQDSHAAHQAPRISYDPHYGQSQSAQYQGGHSYAPSYEAPRDSRNEWHAPQHGYAQPSYEPHFVAAAHNEMDRYGGYDHDGGSVLSAVDEYVAVAPNDHGHRQQRDYDRGYFQAATTIDYHYDEPEAPQYAPRRPLPSILTVVLCAFALMGTAWFEEARTREVAQLVPAVATADLSSPSATDPGDTLRKRVERNR